MPHEMTRREFAAAAGGLLAAGYGLRAGNEENQTDLLRGFIVSDAHFGWVDEQQPDREKQRAMMAHILERFPNLDLFIDTGDAHHGNLRGALGDRAREDWTELISGGCGTVPFYYVPGNHEIMGTAEGDPEWRCAALGSLSCRPYYSFSLKGIHFVSLPELMRAVYINEESLEWLRLDLEAHRGQSVILLSHNNIMGTTTGDEEGYRGLVNGSRLVEIFSRYPNVLAWMHGHNHNYEVVAKHDMLFVSNGRIGGFDPSRKFAEGSHGLGGIYFEISGDGLKVRSYSAERQAFLDDIGIACASAVLKRRTTFHRAAAPSYAYGCGGARDGQVIPVYQHHAGPGQSAELFMFPCDAAVFNDDPDIKLYMARKNREGEHRQLMGAEVLDRKAAWEYARPGIRISANADSEHSVTITVPQKGQGSTAYYRCSPGSQVRFECVVEAGRGGQRLCTALLIHDRAARGLSKQPGPVWTLAPGEQRLETTYVLPLFEGQDHIYAHPSSDNELQAMIMVEVKGLCEAVVLKRLALSLVHTAPSGNRALYVGSGMTAVPENEGFCGPVAIPVIRAREVHRVCTGTGAGRTSWLVRLNGVAWQVRNAPVAWTEGGLEIGPMRSRWSTPQEIIIAPMARISTPFLHRMRGVIRARVCQPEKKDLRLWIETAETTGSSEFDLISPRLWEELRGAEVVRQDGCHYTLRRERPGTIEVRWA